MKFIVMAALVGGALAIGSAAFAEDEAASVGEEVNRICFAREINNFKAIKGEDDAILLERSVNDWYKATLIGACSYRELKWAEAVAIDQRPAGGCLTPGDTLIFSRSAFGDFTFPNTTRCAISKIYKWDSEAAEAEESATDD